MHQQPSFSFSPNLSFQSFQHQPHHSTSIPSLFLNPKALHLHPPTHLPPFALFHPFYVPLLPPSLLYNLRPLQMPFQCPLSRCSSVASHGHLVMCGPQGSPVYMAVFLYVCMYFIHMYIGSIMCIFINFLFKRKFNQSL